MELDDPSMVKKAEPFTKSWALPDLYPGQAAATVPLPGTPAAKKIQLRPHNRLRRAADVLERVVAGWKVREPTVAKALRMLVGAATSPLLARCEIGEILSTLNGRLPAPMFTELTELKAALPSSEAVDAFGDAAAYASATADATTLMKTIPEILTRHMQAVPERERAGIASKLAPVNELVAKYMHALGE